MITVDAPYQKGPMAEKYAIPEDLSVANCMTYTAYGAFVTGIVITQFAEAHYESPEGEIVYTDGNAWYVHEHGDLKEIPESDVRLVRDNWQAKYGPIIGGLGLIGTLASAANHILK
jgi:hypothetical protein